MIGQYATAVDQREVFREIWDVGQREQLHAALIEQSIALAMIALIAGRHHVLPCVPTASRLGYQVIARKIARLHAAVHAHLAIAGKERRITDRWDHAVAHEDLASARNYAVDIYLGDLLLATRIAAAKRHHRVTKRPNHQIAGVESRRLIPARPTVGHSGVIEAKYARCSLCCLHDCHGL